MEWANKPFPQCCLHCYHHDLSVGECGHAQRELCRLFFANNPGASCPIYGDLDVDPDADRPILRAIDRGVRRREDLPDEVVAEVLTQR